MSYANMLRYRDTILDKYRNQNARPQNQYQPSTMSIEQQQQLLVNLGFANLVNQIENQLNKGL